MNYDFKRIEAEVEGLWKKEGAKIRASIAGDRKRPLFSFLEGPPTANAPPGLHHLEVRVFKDLVCRYKFMRGFSVPRKGGWDCHGLPVEVQVEKALGLESKKDVVKYGIAKFNQQCRENVFSRIDDWTNFTSKSAYWIDLANPYITLKNEYIESEWWALKELFKRKLLYEAHKVVPYCPRCETPLSMHEVAQGYKEVTMDSITLKFRVKNEENLYFLAWTTTPWTLPSNLALAVNPEMVYAFVRKGNDMFVLSKGRLEHYFPGKPEVVREVKGRELVGMEYEPLFDYFVGKLDKPAWKVIPADFVSEEDGTGIVHIAPAFGETDYEACKKSGIAFVQPVEKDGRFSKDVREWAGMFVIDADPLITEHLASYGRIFSVEKYTHDYPYCWRCKSPLLYYAMTSWFIAVSKYRKKLVDANAKIRWYPDYIKEGRFGNWLAEARDWALSRTKFWGTPLPIWRCKACGKTECIGSIDELKKKGVEVPQELDLHKPAIDEIVIRCRCGKLMERVPDVIDTWFDSGSATFAQFHYPFESKELFKKSFPYDFIAEAIDQTRGWFYTLHVLGVLLFGKPAYKSVVCAGHLVDANGEKMSKSKGNIIDPWEMFSKYGVDATRLAMCTSAPGNTKRFGPQTIEEEVIPTLNTLWNVYLFTKRLPKARKGKLWIEDEWIVSRASTLVQKVGEALDAHEYHIALAEFERFVVDDLSRWYVKLGREREDAYLRFVLEAVFEKVAKAMAPFIPYFSDFIWTDLLGHDTSVHFEPWPKAEKGAIDRRLEEDMAIIMRIVEASNALRQEKGIKLKYPLASMSVCGEETVLKAAKKLEAPLARMANVKRVEVSRKRMEYVAKPNYAVAGKKFGKDVKGLAEALAKVDGAMLREEIIKRGKVKVGKFSLGKEDLAFSEVGHKAEGKAFEGGMVSLDTEVSEKLKEEWLVRELIRAVQDARKKLGLNVKDKITLVLPDEKAFKSMKEIIKESTNSAISFGKLGGKLFEFEFESEKYEFGVNS